MNYNKLTKTELIKKMKSLERKLDKDPSQLSSKANAGNKAKAAKKDFSSSEAQRLLEESSDRYTDLYDFAPLGYLTLSMRGIIKEINFTACLMLGTDRKKLINFPFINFINKPDTPKYFSHLKACKNHNNITTQLSLKNSAGKIIDVELYSIPVTDYNSKSTVFRTSMIDTSVRKKAEEEHRFLASIVESSDDAIYSKNMDGIIVSWNEGARRIYGYSPEEIIGYSVSKLIPDNHKNDLKMILEKLKRGEKIEQYQTERVTKYGDMLTVSLTISPVKNSYGEIEWASIVARDITAQKKAEAVLHETEEKFRQLAENINDIFYITDPENKKIFYVSLAYEHVFKRSCEELYRNPRSWALAIKEEDRERVYKAVEKQKTSGKFDEEYRIVRPDNSIRWINAKAFPIKDANGAIVKIAGIARDVTEKKEIENILRDIGQRLSTVFREIPSLIIISSLNDGRCIDVNEAFTIITGYKRHEIITRHIGSIGIYKNSSDLDSISKKVLADGYIRDLEINIRTKKGAIKTILLQASKIEIKGEPCILSVGTDITERKRSQEQIESSLKEKEIMLKEIHHRVKNNLQVVSSLLNLQSNYIFDEKAVEAFRVSQNRIRSMALLHEKLYKTNNISQLNFTDYIRDLTNELTNSYSLTPDLVKLGLNIENVSINMDIAINIGLIITELVSNSLKHGFAHITDSENPDSLNENEKIKINIGIHMNSENKLIMNIKDNGNGLPADFNFRETDSLGLQLVNTLVEQIGGNIELKRNGGTEFEIVIPRGGN